MLVHRIKNGVLSSLYPRVRQARRYARARERMVPCENRKKGKVGPVFCKNPRRHEWSMCEQCNRYRKAGWS